MLKISEGLERSNSNFFMLESVQIEKFSTSKFGVERTIDGEVLRLNSVEAPQNRLAMLKSFKANLLELQLSP